MAEPEPERLTEVDIPKLPLYLAFGVIFGVAPMLPNRYNRDLVYLVSTIYKRVGPLGLLGIPFCTLAMEKTAYDTYTAYHGRSIYADAAKRNEPPPQFPSGGAQLPSFSLIETRKLVADPVVFRCLWKCRCAAYDEHKLSCVDSEIEPARYKDHSPGTPLEQQALPNERGRATLHSRRRPPRHPSRLHNAWRPSSRSTRLLATQG